MNISSRGLALIEEFEGCRYQAYKDAHGIWTIGYGHTSGVMAGDTCTPAEAMGFLEEDLQVTENVLTDAVSVALTQNQFDALCSFTFNVGEGNFRRSTLLRLLNAGDPSGAALEFMAWDHVDGTEIAGLERRRAAEKALFEEAA